MEGNGGTVAVRVPVYLSAVAADPVSVTWATADGTALAGTDYEAGSGTVTFAPGELEQTVVVMISGDVTDEEDEAFSILFSNASGAVLGDASVTVAIREDEVVTAVALPGNGVISEKPGTLPVPGMRVVNPMAGRMVALQVTGGAAEAGVDVTLMPPDLDLSSEIPALPLAVVDDALVETDEEVVLEGAAAGPRTRVVPRHPEQTLPAARPPVSLAVQGDLLASADGVDLKILRRGTDGWAEETVVPGAVEGGVWAVAVDAGVIAADFRESGVKLFVKNGAVWEQQALLALTPLPVGVARVLELQDGTLVIGEPAVRAGQGGTATEGGRVRIHEQHRGGRVAWGEKVVLTPPGYVQADFGSVVSLWGNCLAVAAPGSGAVALYERTGAGRKWIRIREFVRMKPGFASGCMVNGDSLVMAENQSLLTSFRTGGETGEWSEPVAKIGPIGLPIGGGTQSMEFAGGVMCWRSNERTVGFQVLSPTGFWINAGRAEAGVVTLPVPRCFAYDGTTLVVTGDGTAEAAELRIFPACGVPASDSG